MYSRKPLPKTGPLIQKAEQEVLPEKSAGDSPMIAKMQFTGRDSKMQAVTKTNWLKRLPDGAFATA
jgi:hypothetical protein